jgi:hypothetical protein
MANGLKLRQFQAQRCGIRVAWRVDSWIGKSWPVEKTAQQARRRCNPDLLFLFPL